MPYVDITVESGTLRGHDDGGVLRFLGVPYGADTGGPHRFRPPQPVPAWAGVRDATVFGPSAPQLDDRPAAGAGGQVLSLLYPRGGSPLEGGPMSEDCLRLNVWAPSEVDEPLPVLVWLHGGAFVTGSGNEMAFNGDVLAAAGRMVVVTVTHRLGIFGFLDLRDLGEPGSANAGLLDLVAALEWVRRNIAAFGADPERVTVCGQSGGAAKVAALSAMPAADTLFQRAVLMSNPMGTLWDRERSATERNAVLDHLGARTVEDLRRLTTGELLAGQRAYLGSGAAAPGRDPDVAAPPTFTPVLDPDSLPRQHRGPGWVRRAADRDVLIGWTAHEMSLLLAFEDWFRPTMSSEEAVALVAAAGLEALAEYEQLERTHAEEPVHLVVARWASEAMFIRPQRELADDASDTARRVWVYEFDAETEVLGGLLGASHSLDLAYVFGTVERIPLTGRRPERLAVSAAMMASWSAFVHTGDPRASTQSQWRPWTRTSRAVEAFGAPVARALPVRG